MWIRLDYRARRSEEERKSREEVVSGSERESDIKEAGSEGSTATPLTTRQSKCASVCRPHDSKTSMRM